MTATAVPFYSYWDQSLVALTLPVAHAIISVEEYSTEDMAAEMEAATVQLKGDKAGLEASVRMKDTALGDISEMSLKVPCSSGVVEEPAAVYAAGLAC